MTRYKTARVMVTQPPSADVLKELRAYMPGNYVVVQTEHGTFVHGRDVAGWTMQDYVIPRLASGNRIANEISPSDEVFKACHRQLLVNVAKDAAPEGHLDDSGPGRYDGASDRELTIAMEFLAGVDGFEAEAGSVDGPGHFGRIGCAVLLTDSQGFLDANVLSDEAQAQKILDEVETGESFDAALGEGRR